MSYGVMIGLEVHVQLSTQSKMFCSCSTKFGEKPNSQTCPVCLGLPGVLPVLNKKALEYGMRTALALNCKIAPFCRFARKNYYYPDLPKNYQISQHGELLSSQGYVKIKVNGKICRIGIDHVHLEEDAGKLIHGEELEDTKDSFVDYNRTGIPLMEIVSEPDISTPEEASIYLNSLKSILPYIEVSDCNMEEGSLRCDANISIKSEGEKEGTKIELKNMNSFKGVKDALSYEIKRQRKLLEEGKEIIQETRLWNVKKSITISMRKKEESQDYRYFPEPDLVPLVMEKDWVEKIQKSLPELPQARARRFCQQYNIPEYDVEVLTSTKSLADYYEECVKLYKKPKIVSNWVMRDLLANLKMANIEIEESLLTPGHLAKMLNLIEEGIISGKIAKEIFNEMFKTGRTPEVIVKEKNLMQIADEQEIIKIIEKIILENPHSVNEYHCGKEKTFSYLMGKIMQATRGKANPQLVNKLLKEKLKNE